MEEQLPTLLVHLFKVAGLRRRQTANTIILALLCTYPLPGKFSLCWISQPRFTFRKNQERSDWNPFNYATPVNSYMITRPTPSNGFMSCDCGDIFFGSVRSVNRRSKTM